MNVMVSVIVMTSLVVLIFVLLTRSGRGTHPEALQEGVDQALQDETRPPADDSPLSPVEGDSRLTQQPERDPKVEEHVTESLTNAASQSRCPACGASITAHDESCPSCEISFVSDGSQKWTLGTAGPPDGIFRPPTDVSA
jgi:hypothetical protein